MNAFHHVARASRRRLFQLTSIVAAVAPAGAATHFVDSTAAPGGAGTSWATAFQSLNSALAVAVAGDEIRVAEGIYKPAATRASSFVFSGLLVRGGFPVGGGPLASIDPVLHPTILSGDIGVAGDPSDNNYHVVVASQSSISGFIIRHGNANGAPSHLLGGGVYATGTVTIQRCKITENRAGSGGGVYYTTNQPGNSLTLDFCVLSANDALGASAAGLGEGGGLLATSQEYVGDVIVDQCSFLGNTATSTGGGAKTAMETSITNSVFSGNAATGPGGGLHAFAPSVAVGDVRNCTFANNDSGYALGAGGVFLSHIQLTNSILWSNTAGGGAPALLAQQLLTALSIVEFCDTQGGVVAGAGNITAFPWFANAVGADGFPGTEDDNLRLLVTSPCVDTGDNARAALPSDREGKPRIRQGKPAGADVVDMGAFERRTWMIVGPTPL